MKLIQLLTLLSISAALLTTCGSPSRNSSAPKFDSATSIALDATVTDGIMLTTSPNYNLDEQIKDQLFFTIGFINNWGGVADLAQRVVTIKSIDLIPGSTTLSKVTYDAKFHVSWLRQYRVPSSIVAPVPARGDYQGLQSFYEKYQGNCVEDRHELSPANFWYYIRPLMRSCPLAQRSGNEELTYLLSLNMAVSSTNTSGKFPEYAKIWEDHKLVATIIFGKNVSGGSDNDYGVSEYNDMYQQLLSNFGNPTETNVNLRNGQYPGTQNPDVRLVFQTNQGTVDVNILLVDSISSTSTEWRKHFSDRTLNSDFVSYNGHAGLGANVRTIGRLGKFKPNQFQLYYLNGCDTYAYLGYELSEGRRLVNPESQPSRYLDLITNSMPSPFGSMASSTMSILTSLYEQKYTYRQILSMVNSGQNPNVSGEEDNRWPQPF